MDCLQPISTVRKKSSKFKVDNETEGRVTSEGRVDEVIPVGTQQSVSKHQVQTAKQQVVRVHQVVANHPKVSFTNTQSGFDINTRHTPNAGRFFKWRTNFDTMAGDFYAAKFEQSCKYSIWQCFHQQCLSPLLAPPLMRMRSWDHEQVQSCRRADVNVTELSLLCYLLCRQTESSRTWTHRWCDRAAACRVRETTHTQLHWAGDIVCVWVGVCVCVCVCVCVRESVRVCVRFSLH